MMDCKIRSARRIQDILDVPSAYALFRRVCGLDQFLKDYVDNEIRPISGSRILDIGCGNGDLYKFLGDVDYVGIDSNSDCIARANSKFGTNAIFLHADLANFDITTLGTFDHVVGVGILYHINDEACEQLFSLIREALNENGRAITADPCFHPRQRLLNRLIVSIDRGQYVRNYDAYRDLAENAFTVYEMKLIDGLFPLPHSVALMKLSV